jgi:hypothetical protein
MMGHDCCRYAPFVVSQALNLEIQTTTEGHDLVASTRTDEVTSLIN